jgi:hypothetical protein
VLRHRGWRPSGLPDGNLVPSGGFRTRYGCLSGWTLFPQNRGLLATYIDMSKVRLSNTVGSFEPTLEQLQAALRVGPRPFHGDPRASFAQQAGSLLRSRTLTAPDPSSDSQLLARPLWTGPWPHAYARRQASTAAWSFQVGHATAAAERPTRGPDIRCLPSDDCR